MVKEPERGPEPAIIEDATCTFCGCLCDDIVLTVDENRITGARNACVLGEAWFLSQANEHGPDCLIKGKPASLDDGIESAARILNDARYPIVLGLCATTSQAQRAAVSLGDWIGACIDLTPSHAPAVMAMQDIGQVTCTLGEVKNRSDLIIFWCCDPVETHPRHLSRYSLEPVGLFVPRGRQDRFCVVVDVQATATAGAADLFLPIKPGKSFEALWMLRGLAKGLELDAASIEAETGVALATWRALMDRMKRARYGAIFTGSHTEDSFATYQNSHALNALVRDMNAHARFVCLSLGEAGNGKGAENVLTWQTGYPVAVNLARGYPRYSRGEYSATAVLTSGEADAALIVSTDPMPHLSAAALAHLATIPSIAVYNRETATTQGATVAFRTAVGGISTPGTVYRMDGVAIPVREALSSPLSSVEEVLQKIERRVRELNSAASSRALGLDFVC